MSGYKDLAVYRKSYIAAKVVYELSESFPKREEYGLASQIRRAATSVPLNIAEGYGKREGTRELLRYIRMARGSNAEVEVLLDFAKDFGYISEEEHARAAADYEQIGKMLSGLINGLTDKTQLLITNA